MPLSRRELLKRGLMATPGLSLARLAEAQINDPGSPPVLPFTRALPIPPVLSPGSGPPGQDSYTITMQGALANILPGRPTPIWTYNGMYPGPTIRARANRQVNILQVNNLFEPMSVHLHGGHAAPQDDGLPDDLINPGALKTYTYPNAQLPATLWYHDHAVDLTGPHVYLGLSGFYIMSDTVEDGLNLPGPGPSGPFAYDVPLMIQDRLFNPNGSLNYPLTDDALVRGVLGDRILVNGVIQPYFRVPRRKVRFRLLNGSNARIYDLRMSNGQQFIQLGSDGGMLSVPVTRSAIRLAPAERADVVIDFTSLVLGTQVNLRNVNRMAPLSFDRAPRDIMRFEVDRNESDASVVPGTLRTFTPLGPEIRTRDFVLTQSMQSGQPVWLINGLPYDPARIDANPTVGDIEIWRFVNNSAESNAMHIHLVQFQIVDIGGVPPGPGENGWKDTVNVPAGQTARVKARFAGFTGIYAFNGQNLERADNRMMGQFQITP